MTMLPPAPDAVLSARNVSKIYGSTHALKGVNFDIHRGKVTTLFGENGAGKSTLMKILSGVTTPTAGTILLDGEVVSFASAAEARDRGISIIHQELSLAPNLSVRDNIFMGRELRTPTGIDFAEEARQARALMADLEEEIDPMTPVEDLRLGQQQIVEIARALSVNSRILIMDEPTSALSASEVEVLFRVIRDLTSRGVSIVYISHHLEEALQITDYAEGWRDHRHRRGARHRPRMDRPQHGRRELRSRFPADRLRLRRGRTFGAGRERRRRLGHQQFRGRPHVARCPRGRDRVHLRLDGRGPH
jgi:erythritol transport system ATP-binding protein